MNKSTAMKWTLFALLGATTIYLTGKLVANKDAVHRFLASVSAT